MSSTLVSNHTPRQCQSPIIFFRATLDGDRNKHAFDWQPYTSQPIVQHTIAAKHAEMLWQPVSYQFIAGVVHKVMANDLKSSSS